MGALRRLSWRDLPKHDTEGRECARLADVAWRDVWHGGTFALSIANRTPFVETDDGTTEQWTLDRRTAHDVVSSVYGSHDGTSRRFNVYGCPECGGAHLGEDAAIQCCQGET